MYRKCPFSLKDRRNTLYDTVFFYATNTAIGIHQPMMQGVGGVERYDVMVWKL